MAIWAITQSLRKKKIPIPSLHHLRSSKTLREFVHYIFMNLLYVKKKNGLVTSCTNSTPYSTWCNTTAYCAVCISVERPADKYLLFWVVGNGLTSPLQTAPKKQSQSHFLATEIFRYMLINLPSVTYCFFCKNMSCMLSLLQKQRTSSKFVYQLMYCWLQKN